MKLKIAGGCGEHGRNCFFIDIGTSAFLVDCGIMAGSVDLYPRLTAGEIRAVRYVFLTHSHADHTGALSWLYKNGFCGEVVASACTLSQLSVPVRSAASLESLRAENPKGKAGANSCGIGGIRLEYGRAGHCAGSVWYHFSFGEGSALFSGDYTEHSPVYRCDNIRGRSADFAVLDCAYGNDKRSLAECSEEIISCVKQLKTKHKTLFFPVPKYGRGIELLKLLRENFPEYVFCGDSRFLEQLDKIKSEQYWYKGENYAALEYDPCRCDILFLSDAQLRSESTQRTAYRLLENGGCGVMTGTAELGSFSEGLIKSGAMRLVRYPVHQNYGEFKLLAARNNFKLVIPYHTAELTAEQGL